MKQYKNFIDGKWIESESKETIKVDDPANGKVIGEISCAKKNEVDLAVDAAKRSFDSRVLVDMPLLARAKLMRRIADETRKIAKEGGELLCYENGKTLGAAVKEFNDVADMFDYYAGLTDKLEGKTIPVSKNVFDYTDGYVARAQNKTSKFGAFLDEWSGEFTTLCIYISIPIYVYNKLGSNLFLYICLALLFLEIINPKIRSPINSNLS